MTIQNFVNKNNVRIDVSLWINNDEPLYRSAVAYMQKRKEQGKTGTYIGFVKSNWMSGDRTPDNIAWDGTRLDYKALNEMMKDLID